MSAQSIRIAMDRELDRLRKIEAPIQRGKEARAVQRVFVDFQPELAEILRIVVRELRDVYGYSWAEVAAEFKISRARAEQLGNA